METDYENTMKTINALKIGIQSIFDRIKVGANSSLTLEELVPEIAGSKSVTESNMLRYLGFIE